MPLFYITFIDWDEANETHATRRASKKQIAEVLLGRTEAKINKKSGTADYIVTACANDGTKWTVVFDYVKGTARPISAWPAN